jgi:hypothetical protein
VSWISSSDVVTSIGLSVRRDTDLQFVVSKSDPDDITLVIGESLAEINFDPSTVEALRDKAADAVRRSREMWPPSGDVHP